MRTPRCGDGGGDCHRRGGFQPIGRAVDGPTPWKLVADLDKPVTGPVDVVGCAYDSAGAVIAASMPATIMVYAGESTASVPMAARVWSDVPVFVPPTQARAGATGGRAVVRARAARPGAAATGPAAARARAARPGPAGDGGGSAGAAGGWPPAGRGGMAGGGGNGGGGGGAARAAAAGAGICPSLSERPSSSAASPAPPTSTRFRSPEMGSPRVIASNRSGGFGDYHLYATTRSATTADFGLPTLLRNVNTADAETKPVLSPNGLKLYFSSDRPAPGHGIRHLYLQSIQPFAGLWAAGAACGGELHGLRFPAQRDHRRAVPLLRSAGRWYGPRHLRPEHHHRWRRHAGRGAQLPVRRRPRHPQRRCISPSTSPPRGSASEPRTAAAREHPDRASIDPDGIFTDLALVSELNTDSAELPSYLSPDGCTLYLDSYRGGRSHLWVAVKP